MEIDCVQMSVCCWSHINLKSVFLVNLLCNALFPKGGTPCPIYEVLYVVPVHNDLLLCETPEVTIKRCQPSSTSQAVTVPNLLILSLEWRR